MMLTRKDVIEAHPEGLSKAIFRFISRNEMKPESKSTEEELLNEIVRVLRDRYSEDLADAATKGNEGEDDLGIPQLYPKFTVAAQEKAEEFKDISGYKRLLAVLAFTLGLVMVTRLKRHYQRAPWFKVGTLGNMLETHGSVSDSQRDVN